MIAALGSSFFITASADPGTPADRAALFDYLLEKTQERTAFSPDKPATLGLPPGTDMAAHVRREMTALRPQLLAADTDMKLFWALSALSNVRRDQHVWITPAEGGIAIDVDLYGPRGPETGHAPVKFKPDYADKTLTTFFVSDLAADVRQWAASPAPEIGDRLLAVNGRPAAEHVALIARYLTSSTNEMLAWSLSDNLPVRFFGVPPEAYAPDARLHLTLERASGERYDLDLPYVPYKDISWKNYEDHPFYGTEAQRKAPRKNDPYANFRLVWEGRSFDLYRSERRKGPLLVKWHRFHRSLLEEIPRLLDYAEREGLTDAGLIWDGTRSTGGSGGAWVLQRLQPRPFRMPYGNLRISDITKDLAGTIQEWATRQIAEAGLTPEAPASPPARQIENIDPGYFLIDWIEKDVHPAIASGQAYTNNVPFKSYFLPRHSDGWVYPARRHLTGPMALLLGPYGCSHLDQFAAMFIDNRLGYSTGMPAGGCSNTWEYEEILKFPGTDRPIVGYAWTAGQAVRINGQVLEGNPAMVSDYVPLTRENFASYARDLVVRAESYIAKEK